MFSSLFFSASSRSSLSLANKDVNRFHLFIPSLSKKRRFKLEIHLLYTVSSVKAPFSPFRMFVQSTRDDYIS